MPLTIAVNRGVLPRPMPVTPAEVVRQARLTGNPNAENALAVTHPILNINQRELHYDRRFARGRLEFRFDTGVLRLTLRQNMYIANDLSACAQGVWKTHEDGHVQDNRRVAGRMERLIRSNRKLQPVFFARRWYPSRSFSTVENQIIHDTITQIFKEATSIAVAARDTDAEYRRIRLTIFRTCPGPFFHRVVRNETLSRISQMYFGSARHWPSIYRVNKSSIGQNPDLIYPGQDLLVPDTP